MGWCGIARWFDYSPEVQERAGLRKVKIPIITDLVSQDEVKPIFDSSLPVKCEDPLNVELYDLGDILGLDPEIEEEREELENLRFAKESLSAERIGEEMGENTDELDFDYGMVAQGEVIKEEGMPVEDDQAPRKRRRNYTQEQLDVLNREFLRGSARMKNAKIAKEISKLNGAREVDTSNVRTWMIKKRRKVDEQASGTNSECESYLKF